MHVGLVSPEFPPDIGGVETYSYELAGELVRRGHHVTVFTRRHPPGTTWDEGLEVRPELALRRRIDRAILRQRVDAWHATNAAYAWMALEAAPVVVSVHGNDFLRPYVGVGRVDLGRWLPGLRARLIAADRRLGAWRAARWIRRGLPRAARIITNSRYTEAVLWRQVPACRGRTTPALVGLSPALMELEPRGERRPGPLRLVTVARLSEPRKGVDRVIQALGHLQGRFDFTYEVIGDGHLRRELEKTTAALGLSSQVIFSGFLARETLIERLGNADLFILTSEILAESHEGFGIVYLEANACGTPVLACRAAGAQEAVKERVSGYFVERPEVEEITSALERFLAGEVRFDPDACQAFARRFTWSRVVDRIEPYYSG